MNSNDKWTKWEPIGGGSDEIIEYVDSAIGDVETTLENIITKYALGGDSV